MKLSTSNLGCFKWDLPETLDKVAGYGFDGIDFRGMRGEVRLWQTPEFSRDLNETARRIKEAGLAVSCISSGIQLTAGDPAKIAEGDTELERVAEICAVLDCRQIRVFGGALSLAGEGAERATVLPRAAERLRVLTQRARAIAPVELLVETHDDWTASLHCVELLEAAGAEGVGCCWDVKHTYWVSEETPAASLARLRPWLQNTHWKDARALRRDYPGEEITRRGRTPGWLCPMGEGIIPLADAAHLLFALHYDGWFTLEWEKHWLPDIAEPDVAFPGFVAYMQAQKAAWEES